LLTPVDSEDKVAKTSPTAVPEYVATLLKSADCKWSGENRPQFDGQRLLSRNIQLDEGLAELGFDSGIRIILQGPARISIDSSTGAVLHSGNLVLHGHESAALFVESWESWGHRGKLGPPTYWRSGGDVLT